MSDWGWVALGYSVTYVSLATYAAVTLRSIKIARERLVTSRAAALAGAAVRAPQLESAEGR